MLTGRSQGGITTVREDTNLGRTSPTEGPNRAERSLLDRCYAIHAAGPSSWHLTTTMVTIMETKPSPRNLSRC